MTSNCRSRRRRLCRRRDCCPLVLVLSFLCLPVVVVETFLLSRCIVSVSSRRLFFCDNDDDSSSSILLWAANKKGHMEDSATNKKRTNRPTVDPNVLFANPQQQQRQQKGSSSSTKRKKNKYSQFSKADKIEKDPLEALLEESERKLQSLREEMDPVLRKKREQERNIPAPPPEASTRLEFPNNKDIDPYDPTTFGYMEIGTIVGPHGVHGWTKVEGCTDFPERLTRAGMPLHIKPARKRAPRKVTLAGGKFIGDDQFLVQLQGIYNRTAAKKLRGATLYYATQQDTVELQDDEMIVSDLVGLEVYRILGEEGKDDDNQPRRLVGTVVGVVLAEEMCSIPGLLHDQIEVGLVNEEEQPPTPGRPQDLVLIPLVPEIVPKIDLAEKMLLVDPPSGLLDLTYVREEKVKIKALLPPAKD